MLAGSCEACLFPESANFPDTPRTSDRPAFVVSSIARDSRELSLRRDEVQVPAAVPATASIFPGATFPVPGPLGPVVRYRPRIAIVADGIREPSLLKNEPKRADYGKVLTSNRSLRFRWPPLDRSSGFAASQSWFGA